MRLQTSDLPVFLQPSLYADDFNSSHADWVYNNNSVDEDCLATWANSSNPAFLYHSKDTASFHSGRWNLQHWP